MSSRPALATPQVLGQPGLCRDPATIEKIKTRVLERELSGRALAVLPEDLDLASSSTHTGQLITCCNYG